MRLSACARHASPMALKSTPIASTVHACCSGSGLAWKACKWLPSAVASSQAARQASFEVSLKSTATTIVSNRALITPSRNNVHSP